MTVLIAWLALRVNVSQESMGSGDRAGRLVRNGGDGKPGRQRWEQDLSAGIRLCCEEGSGRFQCGKKKRRGRFFITGWEDKERQTPMKRELKTPERNLESAAVSWSRHLLVWVDLYTGKKKASHLFVIKTQPGFFKGFHFQKAVWMLMQTPTDDSGSHPETSRGCLSLLWLLFMA